MTDFDFDKLIKRAVTEHIDEYIPESELNYMRHEFSSEFERKMNILIGKSGKKMRITFKRLMTAIIAALIAACIMAMSVSAVRKVFIDFILNIFDTHTDVLSVDDPDAPLDFLDKYEITADLTDLEIESYTELSSDIQFSYKNEHCRLYFTQSIKKYYDVAVNTEGYETENVYINEFEGFYVDMYNQNGKIIIWDNGDYIFTLLVSCDQGYDFSKNELINIAESVQKVE